MLSMARWLKKKKSIIWKKGKWRCRRMNIVYVQLSIILLKYRHFIFNYSVGRHLFFIHRHKIASRWFICFFFTSDNKTQRKIPKWYLKALSRLSNASNRWFISYFYLFDLVHCLFLGATKRWRTTHFNTVIIKKKSIVGKKSRSQNS